MRWTGSSVIPLVLCVMVPSAGAGQRLADWPIRTSALADAVITGPSAIFWNPAALSTSSYRGQATLLHLQTPQLLDLSATAGAVAYRLEKNVIAVSFQHVGIGDITLTEDSPGGDAAQQIDLGETQLAAAASHQLGQRGAVGAIARYAQDNLGGSKSIVGVGAGFIASLDLPLTPRIGGYAISESDDVIWSAGVDLTIPTGHQDYGAGVVYGVHSDVMLDRPVHHVGAHVDWRERVNASAALIRQADSASSNWQPLLAASLRLYRYQLAIARENLSGDFGATWSFSLQVGF